MPKGMLRLTCHMGFRTRTVATFRWRPTILIVAAVKYLAMNTNTQIRRPASAPAGPGAITRRTATTLTIVPVGPYARHGKQDHAITLIVRMHTNAHCASTPSMVAATPIHAPVLLPTKSQATPGTLKAREKAAAKVVKAKVAKATRAKARASGGGETLGRRRMWMTLGSTLVTLATSRFRIRQAVHPRQ